MSFVSRALKCYEKAAKIADDDLDLDEYLSCLRSIGVANMRLAVLCTSLANILDEADISSGVNFFSKSLRFFSLALTNCGKSNKDEAWVEGVQNKIIEAEEAMTSFTIVHRDTWQGRVSLLESSIELNITGKGSCFFKSLVHAHIAREMYKEAVRCSESTEWTALRSMLSIMTRPIIEAKENVARYLSLDPLKKRGNVGGERSVGGGEALNYVDICFLRKRSSTWNSPGLQLTLVDKPSLLFAILNYLCYESAACGYSYLGQMYLGLSYLYVFCGAFVSASAGVIKRLFLIFTPHILVIFQNAPWVLQSWS